MKNMCRLVYSVIIFHLLLCGKIINAAGTDESIEPSIELDSLDYNETVNEDTRLPSENTTKISDETFESCYPYDVCEGDIITLRVQTRYLRNCMCDSRCPTFKDCCTTSKYYKQGKQSGPLPYKCHQVADGSAILMKVSCPRYWEGTRLEEKCHESANLQSNSHNLDLITPVTSRTSNVSYGNAYCALCNFDSNYQYWNVSIECLKQGFDFLKEEYEVVCIAKIGFPNDVPVDYCRQMNVVSKCPKSWLDAEMAESCADFFSLVLDRDGRVYRNRYCAYCNGIANADLMCTKFYLEMGYEPLSILFDFRTRKDVEVCHDNTSDPFIDKVRRHFCTPELRNTGLGNEISSSSNNWFFRWYTTVAICISLAFLLFHLVMFAFVKEMQTFSGKNLASFCLALTLAYANFLFGYVAEGTLCVVAGISTYYFFLVAFWSMLTMSYDLWRVFWNSAKKFRMSQFQRNARFLVYSMWNWITPLFAVALAVHLQFSKSIPVLAPGFGEAGGSCWFNNGFSLLVLFVAPVFAIMLVNCALFAHAICMIRNNHCGSVNRRSRVDFQVFARLALLTGCTWVTGFVAGYFQNTWLWFLFIFLNSTQGVFIFVAFTCKRKFVVEFLFQVGLFKHLRTVGLESTRMGNTTTETGTNMMSIGGE